MTKSRDLEHDITLALDTLQIINNSSHYDALSSHYPNETAQLLDALKSLHLSSNANEITTVSAFIKQHMSSCKEYASLPNDKRKAIRHFFSQLTKDLDTLANNKELYSISIRCALDGYTLNHTTHLIQRLHFLIEEHDQIDQKARFLSPAKNYNASASTFGKVDPVERKINQQAVDLAKNLKKVCEKIRAQIGSPETRPRGLVIHLMVHLYHAIQSCQEHSLSPPALSKLLDSISREVKEIEQRYPKLAQAGEELQNAIATYQTQKPY